MARKAKSISKIPRREKTQRVSKAVGLMIGQKGYGKEPLLTGQPTPLQYGDALNWYSNMCGADEARTFLMNYLEVLDRHSELRKLKRVSDQWIPRTAGWIARMVLNGTDVSDYSLAFLEKNLEEALKKSVAEVQVVTWRRDKNKEECNEVIALMEQLIDEMGEFSVYDFLTLENVKRQHCLAIVEYYLPWYEELLNRLVEPDDQLIEAYRHMTERQIKAKAVFICSLIEDADKYGTERPKKIEKPEVKTRRRA